MNRIGSHQYRTTLPPRFHPAAYPQRPAQRHEQLHAMMPVRRAVKAWAPYDHRGGTGRAPGGRIGQHDRILASGRSRKQRILIEPRPARSSAARLVRTFLREEIDANGRRTSLVAQSCSVVAENCLPRGGSYVSRNPRSSQPALPSPYSCETFPCPFQDLSQSGMYRRSSLRA
jgi:hypothetical protein